MINNINAILSSIVSQNTNNSSNVNHDDSNSSSPVAKRSAPNTTVTSAAASDHQANNPLNSLLPTLTDIYQQTSNSLLSYLNLQMLAHSGVINLAQLPQQMGENNVNANNMNVNVNVNANANIKLEPNEESANDGCDVNNQSCDQPSCSVNGDNLVAQESSNNTGNTMMNMCHNTPPKNGYWPLSQDAAGMALRLMHLEKLAEAERQTPVAVNGKRKGRVLNLDTSLLMAQDVARAIAQHNIDPDMPSTSKAARLALEAQQNAARMALEAQQNAIRMALEAQQNAARMAQEAQQNAVRMALEAHQDTSDSSAHAYLLPFISASSSSSSSSNSSSASSPSSSAFSRAANGYHAQLTAIQTSDELFECKYCLIYFKDAVLYTIHMGYHSCDDVFKCNMCGERCGNPVGLFVHMARNAHV